jgi:hypothetical protein
MSSSSDRPAGLDIRLPMGLFFAIVGVVLTAYGALTDAATNERSLGYNVNLWWGLVLVAFGALLLWLGRKR